MKKKITLSELAKICGCSTATVSYVLNGRKDQRISEETEQKILQMANLYQYRINPYAKALATGELHNIMFFYEYSDFSLTKADTLNFINDLSSFLKKNKYNVIVAPVDHVQKFDFVDAILTYGVSKKKFHDLANKNFVPVISIDTIINDSLFFEITNQFDDLLCHPDVLYLSSSYKDDELNELLKRKTNICFVDSFSVLQQVLQNVQQKRLISLSPEICRYLENMQIEAESYNIHPLKKFEAILQAINDSISRTEEKNHQIRI